MQTLSVFSPLLSKHKESMARYIFWGTETEAFLPHTVETPLTTPINLGKIGEKDILAKPPLRGKHTAGGFKLGQIGCTTIC